MTPERIAELRSQASWYTLPMRAEQSPTDPYQSDCHKLAFALAEALDALEEAQKQRLAIAKPGEVVFIEYDPPITMGPMNMRAIEQGVFHSPPGGPWVVVLPVGQRVARIANIGTTV